MTFENTALRYWDCFSKRRTFVSKHQIMKRKILTLAGIILTVSFLFTACQKEAQTATDKSQLAKGNIIESKQGSATNKSTGAEQISGVASYDPNDVCNSASQN